MSPRLAQLHSLLGVWWDGQRNCLEFCAVPHPQTIKKKEGNALNCTKRSDIVPSKIYLNSIVLEPKRLNDVYMALLFRFAEVTER